MNAVAYDPAISSGSSIMPGDVIARLGACDNNLPFSTKS